MLKTEELVFYELMIIFRPTVLQREAEALVKKCVEAVGGIVEEIDYWGKREMAYKIDREEEGIYVLLFVKLSRKAVAVLRKKLDMEKDVLRIMVVKRG